MTPEGFTIFHGMVPRLDVERVRLDAYWEWEHRAGDFGASGAFAVKGQQYHRKNVHRDFASVRDVLQYLPIKRGHCVTHSKFSYKAVGVHDAWHPHQDAGYKPEPRSGYTVAVTLEEITAEHGALCLFPFSHEHGLLPHYRTDEEQIACMPPNGNTQRMFVGFPGDVCCFSLYTVHASGANTVAGLRAMLFIELEPWNDTLRDDAGLVPEVIRQ